MRILDKDGNELTTYDSSLGYLQNETIIKHIPAVEGVEELFHYVTVKEYPNGGKDVERVIDRKGVEAVPEHDEEEEIYRYTLYTDEELARIEISTLRQYLSTTDWCVIKCMETGSSLSELYPEVSEKRAEARARINTLEDKYGTIN